MSVTTEARRATARTATGRIGRWLLALTTLLSAGCDALPLGPFGANPVTASGGVSPVFRTEHEVAFVFQRLQTDGQRLFAHDGTQTLVALDMTTGASQWTVRLSDGAEVGQAAVGSGRVYTAGDSIRAWDAASGAHLWSTKLSKRATGHIGHAVDGKFYIGTDTSLFALDGATGAILWRTGLGDGFVYDGRVRSVAGEGNDLYVCAGEPLEWNGWRSRGHVIAVDRTTGAIRWRYVMEYETNYNFCIGEPAIAGDLVVVGDAGGNNFVAIDRATGTMRWRYAGEPGWVGPHSPPIVHGDTLYGASMDRTVVAFDRATGRVLWKSPTGSSAQDVARCGRVVLVNSFASHIYDPRNGREIGQYVEKRYGNDDMLVSRFLVHNGYAYVVGNARFYKWKCPQ